MLQWLDSLSWGWIVLVCVTLGLAPFNPPHVLEKLGMLWQGELVRPIDCRAPQFASLPPQYERTDLRQRCSRCYFATILIA